MPSIIRTLRFPLCRHECIHWGSGQCPSLTAIGHHWDHVLIENLPLDLHAWLSASDDVVHFAEGSPSQCNASLHLWHKVSISHHCLAKIEEFIYPHQ